MTPELFLTFKPHHLLYGEKNTANKSITQGWGQRKEIGFCQACRQVLNL